MFNSKRGKVRYFKHLARPSLIPLHNNNNSLWRVRGKGKVIIDEQDLEWEI